ncbi:MAG: type VI secretion system baseplate subunit TssG, partial [Paracraurococcus sp.]
MAAAHRRHARPLIEALRAAPHEFDPRQAALILWRAAGAGAPPGAAPRVEQDLLRLRAAGGFAFPPSDLAGLADAEAGGKPTLSLSAFGLGGAHGPLPAPLGRLAAERARLGDTATRDFLDIFQHRLFGLWLRHWRLFRPGLQGLPAEETNLAAWLLAFLGYGTPGLLRTLGRSPAARLPEGAERGLLAAAGLLARRPVSLHAVERVLALSAGTSVRGVPRRGAWIPLAPGQRTAIGARAGENHALGRDTVLGGRFWDQQAGLRFLAGPMPLPQALGLMPGTPGFARLGALAGLA